MDSSVDNRTDDAAPHGGAYLVLLAPTDVDVYIWGEVSHLRRDGGIRSMNWAPVGSMLVSPNPTTHPNATFHIYKKTHLAGRNIHIPFPKKDWVGGVAVKLLSFTPECVPQPCLALEDVPNASNPSCLEGAVVPHGGFCHPVCLLGHVPTVAELNCTAAAFTPKTFSCVGAPCNSPVGIEYGAWPSCDVGVQVDHSGTCVPQCEEGFIPSVASLNCAYGNLTPTYRCIEAPCYAPGSVSGNFPVCTTEKVGGLTTINTGTTWFLALAPLGANRVAACYEDVSQTRGRTSHCGVLAGTGTALSAPLAPMQVGSGRASSLVLTPLSFDKVILCYRSHAQLSFGVCVLLTASAVSLTSGADFVLHAGTTWRLAAARLSETRALVCYQHASCSCRVLEASADHLSGGAPLALNAASAVYLAMVQLSLDRAAVCVAEALESERGVCRVLVAEVDHSLTQGPEYPVADGATAHLALAPLDDERAVVCYSDWSDREYGKCRIMNSSNHSLELGRVVNITHQLSGASQNLLPGVTRFIALAQLVDVNESAVACFQLAISAQERHGYCKALRINGTDITVSSDLVLNPGTSWNFALAPLSTGKVAVCFSDSTESEHGNCHALMPGYGEETWKS